MRKFAVSMMAAAMVAATVSGCATLGRRVFEEPQVTFRELQINGLGLTGGSLDVVLSVYNPNGYNLDATRLTYNLVLDSIPFANGAIDEKFTVQDKDSTIVRLPVQFSWSGIGSAGRQLLNSGAVNYRVTGDVTVGTPLGSFTKPYSQTGRYTALRGTSQPSR
jgi:LEA14-like dessication related protein